MDKGTVITGSPTVMVDDKPVARLGDTARTCNDPVDAPNGTIIAAGVILADG